MNTQYNQLRLFGSLLFLLLWIDRCPASPFEHIDRHARSAPAHVTENINTLTEYLVKPTINDRQKVRSFYVWIAENIAYDVRAGTAFRLLRYNANQNLKVLPAEVLKRRKAVCQGYAELFQAMCRLSNVPCRLIPGYSRGGDAESRDFTRADHAWNAVNVDQQWYLLDVTWGSGGLTEQLEFVKEFNERYFLTDPGIFIQDHMPLDPVWQLLDCPVGMQSFVEGVESVRQDVTHSTVHCDEQKTIDIPNDQSDSLEERLASAQRAYRFNPANPRVLLYAYMNQAHHLMNGIPAQLRSRETIESALQVQEEALSYLQKAEDLAEQLREKEGQSIRKLLRANTRNARKNLSSLEDALR